MCKRMGAFSLQSPQKDLFSVYMDFDSGEISRHLQSLACNSHPFMR